MRSQLVSFDLGRISRIEVIDENGRAYVRRGLAAALSIQDDGRTLKLFVEPVTAPAEKS